MGEYVKYKGRVTKIGTCQDMYYTSFQKYTEMLASGLLAKAEGSLPPLEYVLPDSGDRFRFPFPDEDKLPFGDIIGPFDRAVSIRMEHTDFTEQQGPEKENRPGYQIDLIRQKHIHREEDGKLCLIVVCRHPETGDIFRIDSDRDIKKLINELVRNHILSSEDPEQKKFYREVASRILKGYRIEGPEQKIQMKEVQLLKAVGKEKGLKKPERGVKY